MQTKRCSILTMAIVLAGSIILLLACARTEIKKETASGLGNGSINWPKCVVTAVGTGVPPEKYYGKPQARAMGLRAAQMDAMRNLLETTRGVQINSNTTVRDLMVESDVISAKVQGMVKNAKTVKQRYLSDGTVEVAMQIALNADFAQIIPEHIAHVSECFDR